MKIKNKIICGETIETLKKIPEKTFDFCFADPPYFLQLDQGKKLFRVEGKEFKGCDDDWDKFSSMDAYKNFTKEWLIEVKRTLKDNGSICVISGMQSIYEIGSILRDLGFWVINDIVWKKSNPTPNFGGTRLNNSHETLIWATKTKKSCFTFNYKTGKFLNGGKQMGSIWEFPVCSGKERLKDCNNQKLHNTQKPESLMYRIIALFTKRNDLILDPFGGTMTTAVIAKRMGRNYTMIEKEKKYIKYGEKRIAETIEVIENVENAIFDKKPIKVSMTEMVESKYFLIGEKFIHNNGKEAILVDKNGKLKYNNLIDSMHEIAGVMAGKDRRINAFDYFYVIRNRENVSIKSIREKYRSDNFKN